MTTSNNTENMNWIKPGNSLPERVFKPDNVQIALYTAVLWVGHRIHYDYPYATEVEKYPGLVIDGPLMGDWLHQCILDWVDEKGELVSIKYSHRKSACIGETLRSGGKIVSCDYDKREVELEVYIKNEADEIIIPGRALVRMD